MFAFDGVGVAAVDSRAQLLIAVLTALLSSSVSFVAQVVQRLRSIDKRFGAVLCLDCLLRLLVLLGELPASLTALSISSLLMLVEEVMVMCCSLPVPLSVAVTLTMPLASISNVTSICGTPRGGHNTVEIEAT